MTDLTADRPQRALGTRISAWVGRRQQEMSDRLHAEGDRFAAEAGWTASASTGRFGFGARTYRDPRFNQLRSRP